MLMWRPGKMRRRVMGRVLLLLLLLLLLRRRRTARGVQQMLRGLWR